MTFKSSFFSQHTCPTARRGGQALILAVLLMLLAALLSSTFLVIVATNTQQSSREIDKSDARDNSIAGVNSAKKYLAISSNADNWAPESVAALVGNGRDDDSDGLPEANDFPPDASSPDYDFYWTQLDKTMGWALPETFAYSSSDPAQMLKDLAALKSNGQAVYVKIPDPRLDRTDDKTPHYMIESRLLTQNADEVTDGGDKKFMLRVTSVGRLVRNENSWSKTTAYKQTNFNGGTLSFANFVTNYDTSCTASNCDPLLKTSANAGSATYSGGVLNVTVSDLTKVRPAMLELGRTLMVSDGKTAPFSGVLKAVNGAVLSLRALPAPSTGLVPASVVFDASAPLSVSQIGSLMHNPTGFDADGNLSASIASGVINSNTLLSPKVATVSIEASANMETRPYGNGTLFNLGLTVPDKGVWAGRKPRARSWTGFNTYSGQNFLTVAGPVDGISNLEVRDATQASATPVPMSAPAPANNRYFRVGFDEGNRARVENYLSNVDPLDPPRNIAPAKIDFASYVARAKGTANATVGGLGYGPGVFLDNSGDVESFGSTLKPLSNGQLQRLWQRKSFLVANGQGNVTPGATGAIGAGTTGARLAWPRIEGAVRDSYSFPQTSGSLEQKAIRGWISPWEFLPRGAQIILNGNTITIVRDPISDASTTAPDTSKSWQTTSATPIRGAYTMSFDAASLVRKVGVSSAPVQTITATEDFNGLIVASGNLRVRGNWTGTKALTIVSNANIYIENSLTSTQTAKIALLAKRNVTLNPTQFITRPIGAVDRSIAINSATVSGTSSLGTTETGTVTATNSVTIAGSATRFSLGDAVMVGGKTQLHIVKAIGGNTLTVAGSGLTVSATPVKVQQLCDPPVVAIDAEARPVASNSALATQWNYAFRRGNDTISRQVLAPGIFSVAARHSAEKVNVGFVSARGGDYRIRLQTKKGANATGWILPFNSTQTLSFPSSGNPGTEKIIVGEVTQSEDGSYVNDNAPISTFSPFDLRSFSTSGSGTSGGGTTYSGDDRATLGNFKTMLETPGINNTVRDPYWGVTLPAPTPIPGATPIAGAPTYSDVPLRFVASDDCPAGASADFPLTTSMGFLLAADASLDFAPFTGSTPPLRASVGSWFGYQPNFPATSGADASQTDSYEDARTTVSSFYGVANRTFRASDGSLMSYSASTPATATASNSAILTLTRPGFKPFHDLLPGYFLSGYHIENGTFPTSGAITPTLNVSVQATIYAEQGSWFVVPVPAMVNANSLTTSAQTLDAARFRRPFFKISVQSDIAQAFTPTATVDYDDEPDPDGRAWGATKSWLDSLALPTQASAGTPINWQTIEYQAAPLPLDHGLILPTSSDVLYTSTS